MSVPVTVAVWSPTAPVPTATTLAGADRPGRGVGDVSAHEGVPVWCSR